MLLLESRVKIKFMRQKCVAKKLVIIIMIFLLHQSFVPKYS